MRQMEIYKEYCPNTHFEMLLNNNTSAISHALNTTNESINMSFILNPQENLEPKEQTPNNEQEHSIRDLGNPHPATDT
jgi:hypothetical protein